MHHTCPSGGDGPFHTAEMEKQMPHLNMTGQEARERAAQMRAEAQANAAEARAEGQAQGLAARTAAAEMREEALGQADLAQQRAALFRLTGEDDFLNADHFSYASFTALNGSGVVGGAILAFDDETDTLTVAIAARGLEANQTHIQHIHGFPDGTDATTPTLAQDADGDGYVELAEGVPAYGPVLLNLSTDHENGSGGDNGHSHGDVEGFPTAPDGMIWFLESYQLPEGDLGADPMLTLREIVIHGMSTPAGAGAGTPGEVDGTAGYKLVLPVASGEINDVISARGLRDFIEESGFDDVARARMQDAWVMG